MQSKVRQLGRARNLGKALQGKSRQVKTPRHGKAHRKVNECT
jgi:hypothetical protein